MPDLTRYLAWAAVIALGALLAAADRRWTGKPLLGALLLLGIVGGYAVTVMSPFSFAGGHYMEGVILMAGCALALAGYVVAFVVGMVRGRK